MSRKSRRASDLTFGSNPAVGGTGTITGTLASMASGTTATFTIVVMRTPGDTSGSTINNTATVGSSTTDPNAGNNSSTVSTTIAATTTADVGVTIAAPVKALASSSVAYTVTVTNNGRARRRM